MIDCSLSDISNNSAQIVYEAAGKSLKKVNLSKNSIMTVPSELFEQCPSIVSLLLAKNEIQSMPQSMLLLTNLVELNLSCNQLNDEIA